MTDHYATLGVAKDASPAEIKKAYKTLAKRYHPDNRETGDAVRMQAINEAYDVLSTPEKRAAYDRPAQEFNFGFGGGSHTFDFSELFGHHMRSDIFGHMQRNRDLTVQCQITLEEAFVGTARKVQFIAPDQQKHDVDVNIPAGVDSGHRIRIAGGGDRSRPNMPAGDLFILIQVAPHQRFNRVGQNLFCEVTIDAVEAMVGTSVDVPTIDGSTIRVNVPPGMQYGEKLRVPQKGMRTLRSDLRGDLYVILRITIPKLSAAMQAELRALQQPMARAA